MYVSRIRIWLWYNLKKLLSVEIHHDRYPRASRGRPPRFLPSPEGLGLLPGTLGDPFQGNTDGTRGIFGAAGKALYRTHPNGWTEDKYRSHVAIPSRRGWLAFRSSSGVDPVVSSYAWSSGHFTSWTKKKKKQ